MKKPRWLLPTNTNNTRMIISQGLLTAANGFAKYYRDVLEQYNGWIPLFKNNIPPEKINYATSEDANMLTPCILEIDLGTITGRIKALKGKRLFDLELNGQVLEDEAVEMIFIPPPLPLSCLAKILFENRDRLEEFKADAEIRGNVILDNLKLQSTKTDQKLFKTEANKLSILPVAAGDFFAPPAELPECGAADYPKIYAFGGMLAMLFYIAKNGGKSNVLYKKISKNALSADDGSEEIKIISDYFFADNGNGADPGHKRKMFHGIIDIAVKSRDFKNNIFNFLAGYKRQEDMAAEKAGGLAQILQDHENNLTGRPLSRQFADAGSELEKILLMLFVREDCESFAEYHSVTFQEMEYFVFAMMFGIRDKFSRIPAWLKKYRGLQLFVSAKMAEYAHRLGGNMRFRVPAEPATVWELVNKKFAGKTIALLGIRDCLETIMPKGDFALKNGQVIYPAFVEPDYNTVGDKYFRKISSLVISDDIYNKLL